MIDYDDRPTTHVVCIGDSITAGSGAAQGYPVRLQAYLPGVVVQGFGAPSTTAGAYGPDPYTASQPYADLVAMLSALPPSAGVDITVMLGTNDAVSGAFTAEAYAADYEALVTTLEAIAPHPHVYVVVPPPSLWNVIVPTVLAPLLGVIADRPGRALVDIHGPMLGAVWLMIPDDWVHPNDNGHAFIARLLRAARVGS